MINLIDMHSHSKNSPDARDTVMDMCNRAKELNLKAYAITDHVECKNLNWYNKNEKGEKIFIAAFEDVFNGSMNDITAAKQYFGDSLNLLYGIELGEPMQDIKTAEKYISDSRLDFIIASLHEIKNHEDFYYLDYEKENIPLLFETYFSEIYETCVWNKFDVLGHFTLPLRYIAEHGNKRPDMKPYEEIIRNCFKVLIENGKGIEINTSGLRQKMKDTMPSLEYVKMFRQMGGEILTIGSDAHNKNDIGKGLSEAQEMAKQAGFKYLTYFKNRKPQFVKI